MLIQKEITNVIVSAKNGLDAIITKIKLTQDNGDDTTCLKIKLITTDKWIQILSSYVENNFDENGNIKPPTTVCLNETQIALIMSKLTSIYGNNNVGLSDWLLKDYFWDDSGFWRDSATWNDVKPII